MMPKRMSSAAAAALNSRISGRSFMKFYARKSSCPVLSAKLSVSMPAQFIKWTNKLATGVPNSAAT